MKNPLGFQRTEYDCATVTFLNALSYLYEREELPVEFEKAIYEYTLDEKNSEGIIGKGGTSKQNVRQLVQYFQDYISQKNFDMDCKILEGRDVSLWEMQKAIQNKKVVIALCCKKKTIMTMIKRFLWYSTKTLLTIES